MLLKKGLYKGFSTFAFQQSKTLKIRDLELVKLDLLNHLFTKKGERVMMPAFGTVIPELVMEPLTDGVVDLVQEEVTRVINYDPRVELLTIQTVPDYDRSSITVAARLFFIELNMTTIIELNIEFEGS